MQPLPGTVQGDCHTCMLRAEFSRCMHAALDARGAEVMVQMVQTFMNSCVLV